MTTGLVGQHQLAPFASPQPGQPLDATVVLGNDNSTVTTYDAHDSDSTIHFQSSALVDRPPASTLGQKWLTTDAGARYIYYDNGSAWVEVDYFRDTGGTIVGDVTVTGNVSISGTLGVTGVATFTAAPILSSLTASKPVFTNSSKGLVSTGTLGTDQGGTNLTTYTTGDILYASATNVLSKLAIGTTGQHLIVSGGVPAWSTDSALGTVTSVSWTGGLVSVATATTTPAFTVAGTSGGIPYFSSASTWASSAALTQYGIVYGGGAGATPVATAAGTTGQVLTAVTSGAPVWSATYAGTVTSVGFTGGLISVATATTTPALTVAGTSGGVVYFSSASTWASSAALTASAIVLGGGAGAAPATTTTGTGVVTALGVNVGTAGAFVVNGGALGTPSSGAVAASLITAGTFGAGAYTFPGALAITGAFTGVTTLTASSTATIGAATSPLLLDRLADYTNYGAMSFNASLTSTTMNGLYGRLNATDGGLYITAPSGSSTKVQVAGSTVATFAGALTTLATPLAINGAFTGATTGAFSGLVAIGGASSVTPYTALLTVKGAGGTFFVRDSGGEAYFYGAASPYYFGTAYAGSSLVLTSGNGTAALTLSSTQAATFASSLAINGAFTGATTGTFSSTLAVTGIITGTAKVESNKIVVGLPAVQNDSTGVANTLQLANYSAGAFVTGSADNYIYKTSTVIGGIAAQSTIFQTRSDTTGGGWAWVAGSTPAVVASISSAGAATFSSTLAVTGAATFNGSTSGSATIDGSSSISIANGAAYTNSAYRGMVLITDKTSGETAIIIYNNGAGTVVSQTGSQYTGTIDTASKVNVFASSGTMKVQNNLSTRNFGITVFNGG